MIWFKLILCLVFIQMAYTKNILTVKFIKSFLINERKPTILTFGELCWGKKIKLDLAKEIFMFGGRTFTSTYFTDIRSKNQDHFVMFLLDLDCSESKQIIQWASERNIFRSPYRWLVMSNSTGLTQLQNSPVLLDSDVVLAQRTKGGFTLVEIHKTSPNGTLVSTPRGIYNGSYIDLRMHRELFRRRRDLMGHPLTMSNVIQDSNSTQYHLPREDALQLQNDVIPKISWKLTRLVFEMVNATPQYIFSYRWGYKVNGTWSGMIDDLRTAKADLGTDCIVDSRRLAFVTFTDSVAPYRVKFIFRQPPLANVANIFSLPFSNNVWLALIICCLASTAAVYLAFKWEANLEKDSQYLTGNIGDALLLTMSAVSQQGCVIESRRAPGRIMLFVIFSTLMALYVAYSANIVVLLQAPSNSIKSLADLVSSKITLGAYDIDYNRFVFSLYKDPVHVAVDRKINPEKGKGQFFSMEEGVEKIRQGLFAFHSVVEVVYRRIEQTFLEMEKCDLTEVGFFSNFAPHVPMKKDSPYIEMIRVAYKQIREVGIRAALNKRYQVSKPPCSTKGAAFNSVGLSDMQPVFILMLYGVAISLAILALEMFVYKM